MKTLLFAPLFLDEGERLLRNTKWIDFIMDLKNKGFLHFDEILYVDNASGDEKLKQFEKHIEQYKNVTITIIKCKTRLSRWSQHAYGFWYSAFGKAAKYAIDNKYEKIIHIDTDVYLLKPRICDYVNNFTTGWLCFFCPMHNYPESTFQLIGKDKFETMYEFMTRDFLEFYPNDLAETRIPWTHVEKNFVGDRYGERNLQQTPDMEFYGQCAPSTKMEFKP